MISMCAFSTSSVESAKKRSGQTSDLYSTVLLSVFSRYLLCYGVLISGKVVVNLTTWYNRRCAKHEEDCYKNTAKADYAGCS